jgi:hypothetical protein
MITVVVAVESAFLGVMAACRKRMAVIRTLNPNPSDSGPVKLLTRSLSRCTTATTPMQQMIARHITSFARSFVQTGTFDQLVLSAVARIRAQLFRKGGVRWS